MATPEDIAALRLKINEPDDVEPYTDAKLDALIDAASGDTDAVAADIWAQKASQYAELVDISEAGSSRKNSQLYKNALEMAAHFRSDVVVPAAGLDFSTTRAIVRP